MAANRYGQQLFFADMGRGPHTPIPAGTTRPPLRVQLAGPGQLTLFAVHRDLAAHGRAGLPPPRDPTLAADLGRHAQEHAVASGWSPRLTTNTCHGLRILLGLQDVPGAPIPASDVTELRRIKLPFWTVLEVLAGAGLLAEDRTSVLDVWFAEQTDGLPEQIVSELSTWWEIMKRGSATPPRRRPRSPTTARLHLSWAVPALRVWAAAGHTTLRAISREDVLNALPPSGNPRANAGQGLKSIFRVLKGRKIVFVDPTAHIQTGYTAGRQPVPLDVAPVRAALQSPHPAQAAVVALIAFHGLRAGQVRTLRLTDLRDGRLHHDGRTIPLAEPVRVRLAAYLDYRNHRWPESRNPYLFVHYRTGHRTTPVGLRWVWLTIGPGLSATALREDRILDEARVTGGDVRRICDLFGLSIQAACRYTAAR
ncbi:site-specific integrase [Lentzea atacamensis]|uniref:site-specific integrase n=1 Tax=Lentzea atacamensis TaxID=531938 RepID=UPI001B8790C8|nr:site-specific integrase [Lentzea atacamensis]